MKTDDYNRIIENRNRGVRTMCTAMIIDDDVPMLKYLETILNWEELGIEIVASTFSSLKALSLFEELQPDLVITDIGLPQIDGLELAVRFKEKNPDIRVILLTCHEDFYYAKKPSKSMLMTT